MEGSVVRRINGSIECNGSNKNGNRIISTNSIATSSSSSKQRIEDSGFNTVQAVSIMIPLALVIVSTNKSFIIIIEEISELD